MASTVRPASSRPRPTPADVLPTTKWANRVLRPLNSIVLRLEKHWKSTAPPDCGNSNNNKNNSYTKHAQHNNTHTSPRKRASLPGSTARGRFNDGGAELSGSEYSLDDSDDPSWVPGQDIRKKVRHKYSSGNPRVRGGGGVSIFKSPEVRRRRRRSLPGEITIATPLIIGKTRHIFGAGVDEVRPSGLGRDSGTQVNGENRFGLNQKGAHGRQNDVMISKVNGFQDYDDLGYLAIVDGICPVFEAFLRATSNRKPETTHGAKSLLSMALGKVSDYIRDEQKSHDESEDKDEDVDVADAIFTEMEDFYGLPGGGWKPLKELVRAHGIRLVCESVRKKWISPQTTQRLILSSLRLPSHEAAKSLFSSLLSIAPGIERPKGLHNCLFSNISPSERSILSPYLDMVSTGTPGHLSFFFQEVRLLILRGVVPVEWMATESMKPFMNRAVQSISCGDENFYSAIEFLEAVVLVAAGIDPSIYEFTVASLRSTKRTRLRPSNRLRSGTRPLSDDRTDSRATSAPSHLRTALNNTLSSLITLLCGIHVSRFGVGTEDPVLVSSPARDMIARLSTAVQQDIELRCSHLKSEFTALQSTRCSYILLGEYLCLGANFGNGNDGEDEGASLLSNFDSFIQTMSHRKDLLGDLSALVEQVVSCCGRALGTDGFEELKGFSQILTSSITDSYPSLKLLLGKVAVESAMSFAESTQHADHHDWATCIQTKAAEYSPIQDSSDDADCPTPSLPLSKTGFRWEDSIGEWVAKTPAAISAKKSYIDTGCRTTIPDSEDSYSSPVQRFSDRKTSFAILEDSSSVVSSSPPQSCQKRKRVDSSPFVFDTVPRKRSRAAIECGEVTAHLPATTSPSRPQRLRQKHAWKPYTDDVVGNETYPLPLSPSRTSERFSTSPPRRRTDRETRTVTGERVLRERNQNTHLPPPTTTKTTTTAKRPQKRKSITFEVVIVNKKRKTTGHDRMSDDEDNDEDNTDADDGDGEWSGSSPRVGSRSRRRTHHQFQRRSPSEEGEEESHLTLSPGKRTDHSRGRLPRPRRSEVVDTTSWMAPCSGLEVADSEGSDDELSFLS